MRIHSLSSNTDAVVSCAPPRLLSGSGGNVAGRGTSRAESRPQLRLLDEEAVEVAVDPHVSRPRRARLWHPAKRPGGAATRLGCTAARRRRAAFALQEERGWIGAVEGEHLPQWNRQKAGLRAREAHWTNEKGWALWFCADFDDP
eukprot:CAMPEP_0196674282 /NCGR_PEP_ID=MMETSP1090-20130531/3427_1 /TAXON_ID=37098 /ORGANISM="Isochrysis sp, Strain CCMP1244" /LENGTH=144 /DNA_ID=CAMNT_0042012083 /DNA_START=446 /DNA_END=879 /DNA_ORIENTATION=+